MGGDQTCEEAMAVMDACNTRSLDQYTKDADTLESYEDFARKTCTMINTIYDCIVTLSKDCPRAEKPYLDGMGPRMDSMGEGNEASLGLRGCDRGDAFLPGGCG